MKRSVPLTPNFLDYPRFDIDIISGTHDLELIINPCIHLKTPYPNINANASKFTTMDTSLGNKTG